MSTSSIDELLLGGGNATQPETPEHQYQEEPEEIEEMDPDETLTDDDPDPEEQEIEDDVEGARSLDIDEYGNEKEPENEVIRDRLKKQAESMSRKHEAELAQLRAQLSQQGASQQLQQAAKDFEYNPDGAGDWQQQLAQFVKQTVNSMTREQEEAKTRQQEHEVQQEFETKFRTGMGNFSDFTDVIGSLPFTISNPMTLATRAMADPAAFLYAAAKRQPQELERISKLRDPYAQMTEIGKLEERMRRNKPTTKAPRPLARTNEDATIPTPKKKSEPTIEDLIAKADAKKLNRIKRRQGGRR